jgi:hypothetical protein
MVFKCATEVFKCAKLVNNTNKREKPCDFSNKKAHQGWADRIMVTKEAFILPSVGR